MIYPKMSVSLRVRTHHFRQVWQEIVTLLWRTGKIILVSDAKRLEIVSSVLPLIQQFSVPLQEIPM
jgi:hypothetical protein